jgi:hypothetical protein
MWNISDFNFFGYMKIVIFLRYKKTNMMTVLERKARLVTAILNNTDVDRLKNDVPSFMCSVEELNESLSAIERDFAEGNIQSVTSGQMRKKHERYAL